MARYAKGCEVAKNFSRRDSLRDLNRPIGVDIAGQQHHVASADYCSEPVAVRLGVHRHAVLPRCVKRTVGPFSATALLILGRFDKIHARPGIG